MLVMLALGCTQMEPPPPPTDLGMVLIPAATFTMGSPETEKERHSKEVEHQVTLTRDFYLMEAEVTQGLWKELMVSNPSYLTSCGDSCPVENVSWNDTVDFANRLSKRHGLEECYRIEAPTYHHCKTCGYTPISPRATSCPTCGEPQPAEEVSDTSKITEVAWPKGLACDGYRLPSEAEWEYAAKGGESYVYAGSDTPGDVAWYEENSGDKTHPVCGKQRNGYKLCDMSGNVSEWVWDRHGLYPEGSVQDPLGSVEGPRLYRGGYRRSSSERLRSSSRAFKYSSANRKNRGSLGFRLARTAP